jgi:lipid-A-disaccharide synthase
MVVVYRLAWLTYLVGLLLVRIAFFSLVNLIAGKRVVPELLQRAMTPARIAAELKPLLSDSPERRAQLDGFDEVRRRLGAPGASSRVAEEVLAACKRATPWS